MAGLCSGTSSSFCVQMWHSWQHAHIRPSVYMELLNYQSGNQGKWTQHFKWSITQHGCAGEKIYCKLACSRTSAEPSGDVHRNSDQLVCLSLTLAELTTVVAISEPTFHSNCNCLLLCDTLCKSDRQHSIQEKLPEKNISLKPDLCKCCWYFSVWMKINHKKQSTDRQTWPLSNAATAAVFPCLQRARDM